nr:MAG TPA: hypothetical protein [Caudoviricetes sp.]
MTIIVNGAKAYINPSVVDTAGGKLTVNSEVVKAKLTDNEQDDVMHACEYGGVAYVTTDD